MNFAKGHRLKSSANVILVGRIGMPLSDDLNRTRLKRRIDELHVDVRRMQRPQERHQALKELDQLTVEYIRALCTEMKYVSAECLAAGRTATRSRTSSTEELLEPLMLQETYREVVERLGWSLPVNNDKSACDLA